MSLKILVIGGGGREHALVHQLRQSRQVGKIFCAPGNAGIAQEADCVAIASDNIPALFKFAQDKQIDLTMVGPEAPLVAGIVDHFRNGGLKIIGPTRTAARLEGSKSYAKDFMRKYGIATARFEVVPNLQKGSYLLQHWKGACVVKADGLAAGKGVKVCSDVTEAKAFLFEIMEKEVFGSAGSTAVLEECLTGEETTIMAFCDGKTLVAMPASQDHKRLLDNDEGPNTGGMGAYAPAPLVTPALMQRIETDIFQPFLKGLMVEGFDYRGIIYFGIMVTATGPQVLEFNVRFGDPETQVILPLLDTDLVDIFQAMADQRLASVAVRWKKKHSICVVLASEGYPGAYAKGKTIRGLKTRQEGHVKVFHAGTESKGSDVVTSGGRVLGVTAIADSLEAAKTSAYHVADGIGYDGKICRRDIGAKALRVSERTR